MSWLFSILVPLPPQGSAHTAFYIKYYCQDALEWPLQLPVGSQQKHSQEQRAQSIPRWTELEQELQDSVWWGNKDPASAVGMGQGTRELLWKTGIHGIPPATPSWHNPFIIPYTSAADSSSQTRLILLLFTFTRSIRNKLQKIGKGLILVPQ